jgi:hypothetical protein
MAVTFAANLAMGTAHPPVPAPMSSTVDAGCAFSKERMKSLWESGLAHRCLTLSLKERALSRQ